MQTWKISFAKRPDLQCLQRQETHQFTFNYKPKVWKGFYMWSNQHTEMKFELGWTGTFLRNNTISFSCSTPLWAWNHVRTKTLICMGRASVPPSVLVTQSWTDDISKQNKTVQTFWPSSTKAIEIILCAIFHVCNDI